MIGFLTILGYSLYDTVVVFDKVRENTAGLAGGSRMTYSEAANLAVNQTLVRSINTSLVALLPVAAILFVGVVLLGAGPLKDLSLALFVGMAVGAYSSIFIATPLLAHVQGARARDAGARQAGRRPPGRDRRRGAVRHGAGQRRRSRRRPTRTSPTTDVDDAAAVPAGAGAAAGPRRPGGRPAARSAASRARAAAGGTSRKKRR